MRQDLEAEDLEERHESTDTDEDEAAEEAQGSKEEGAEERRTTATTRKRPGTQANSCREASDASHFCYIR